jgi:isoleucyl-tRNA synthetase
MLTRYTAYRLYTVVPKLIGLIDNTTNWYIRFNRKRLKGENGLDDTLHALNTLFEVLFTLCRGFAPFTPFLTDTMYLRLLPHSPESARGKDPRSIHFLPFPEVRQELFNAEIERQVQRMQKVIELARYSRERRTIGLKQPLKTLIVIHHDPEYLEDIRSLQGYITEELNVHELVLTSDEASYGVQYSVTADWPVLGKKLKKDMGRVKKALPSVTSDEAHNYSTSGKLVVDGITLVEGDLVVRRGLKEGEASKNLETNTDNDVLTILDTEIYDSLLDEGLAREIINRVQRLRKKAGLQVTDDIKMEYKVLSDPENTGIERVFETHQPAIAKALRRPLDKHEVTHVEGKIPDQEEEGIIAEEEQEVNKAIFLLRLLKL